MKKQTGDTFEFTEEIDAFFEAYDSVPGVVSNDVIRPSKLRKAVNKADLLIFDDPTLRKYFGILPLLSFMMF